MTDTPEVVPAEVVRDGVAMQRINAFHRDGSFYKQIRIHGTEKFARDLVDKLVTPR